MVPLINGAFIKVRLHESLVPAIGESIQLYTWASGNGDEEEIVAEFSDVFILTANNLQFFAGAGFIDGDTSFNGTVGLEDIIESLRMLGGY